MKKLFLNALYLLLGVPFVVFLHEMGHYFAIVTQGGKVTDFHVGRGNTVLTIGFIKLKESFNGGYCEEKFDTPQSTFGKIFMFSAGPLLTLTFGLFLTFVLNTNPLWFVNGGFTNFSWLNMFSTFLVFDVLNLVPIKSKDLKSDGYEIASLLVKKLLKNSN